MSLDVIQLTSKPIISLYRLGCRLMLIPNFRFIYWLINKANKQTNKTKVGDKH